MPATTLSPAELPVRARRRITAPPGVDPLTWAPRDYAAFGEHFRDMTVSHVRRALAPAGASDAEIEDGASTMMERFIRNDGLALYDAGKIHLPPEGGTWRDGGREPRVAQFTGMYSSFLRRSGPGLRDQYLRRARRSAQLPEEDGSDALGAPDTALAAVDARLTVADWLDRAEARLWAAGRGDLVPAVDAVREALAAGEDAPSSARLWAELDFLGLPAESLRRELAAA